MMPTGVNTAELRQKGSLGLKQKENNMNKSSIRKKLILTVVMLALALGAAVPALAQTDPPTPEEEPAEQERKQNHSRS